jgi:long-chain acyl-CoA synthetase
MKTCCVPRAYLATHEEMNGVTCLPAAEGARTGNYMPRTSDIIDPKTAETLAGLFRERVRRTPGACAYRRYSAEPGRFEGITWDEVSRLAARWQAGLERENLRPGDRVAVMLRNSLEWALFDLAALGLGLVTVPLFADDRPENAAYILRETGSRLVLIDEAEKWRRVCAAGKGLDTIERVLVAQPSFPGCADVPLDFRMPAEPGARDLRLRPLAEWLPDKAGEYRVCRRDMGALATIVYTSGTTGMPKGVMLSHGNILENAFACLIREKIYPEDLFLSFLPLSHTLERTVGYYIPIMAGACVAYARSIDKLAEDLHEVRPTVLISVPRIYERLYKKIVASLEAKRAASRSLFRLAVHIGWRRFLYLQNRRRWTLLLLLWPLLNRTVGRHVTSAFGGRLRLAISGGAALALPIARIFLGLGLNILQGYGLTEAGPVVAFNPVAENRPETVGRPLPGVEAVVENNGELLVRGPNVMLGYWRSSEATQAAIDPEGFLHTGDVVRLDADGHIMIDGRIKEIIVLSNGEKVPPGELELAIAVNPLFEQVMIVGEGRPYLAALVVLNRPRWVKLAVERGLSGGALNHPGNDRAHQILLSEIAGLIRHFPGYAQIRRVRASLDPWTTEDGLVTATLKLRRHELMKRFEKEVEALFEGHE